MLFKTIPLKALDWIIFLPAFGKIYLFLVAVISQIFCLLESVRSEVVIVIMILLRMIESKAACPPLHMAQPNSN